MHIAYVALIEIDICNACVIHTREITEQIAAIGHEVTLFLPNPLRFQNWKQVNHVWIKQWGFGGIKEALFHLESSLRLYGSHLMKRFDVLYLREMFHNGLIPYLCKCLHLPLFIEVNGWLLDDLRLRNASLKKIVRATERQRQLFHQATGIVASTFGVAENIVEIYGVDRQKILVQQLGSNPVLFKPGDKKQAREKLGLPTEAEVFLFAGSFSQNHDLKLLLSAFHLFSNIRPQSILILLGDGTTQKDMEKKAYDLGISEKVIFAGSVDYEDVGIWMQAADAGVIPLTESNIHRRNGCMTLKLWDYLSSGLPVIATDLPDTRTYRDLRDYAIFVAPNNEKMMAEAMLQLMENSEKRIRLSEKGRSLIIQQRSWRKAAMETNSFIQRQLNK